MPGGVLDALDRLFHAFAHDDLEGRRRQHVVEQHDVAPLGLRAHGILEISVRHLHLAARQRQQPLAAAAERHRLDRDPILLQRIEEAAILRVPDRDMGRIGDAADPDLDRARLAFRQWFEVEGGSGEARPRRQRGAQHREPAREQRAAGEPAGRDRAITRHGRSSSAARRRDPRWRRLRRSARSAPSIAHRSRRRKPRAFCSSVGVLL
jgi:hypothetical protein